MFLASCSTYVRKNKLFITHVHGSLIKISQFQVKIIFIYYNYFTIIKRHHTALRNPSIFFRHCSSFYRNIYTWNNMNYIGTTHGDMSRKSVIRCLQQFICYISTLKYLNNFLQQYCKNKIQLLPL